MTDFQERVFEAVAKIPKGNVASYGDIATAAGSPKASRAVGNILHNNPLPGIIPCHRVVHSDGHLAPAFAFGGEEAQKKLLISEGVTFVDNITVDMNKHRYKK